MKILIDTNVVLDVLLKREPFYGSGAQVLILAQRNDIKLYVSASTITDIYYIANRSIKNKEKVKMLLENLVKVVMVASVSEREIKNAFTLLWEDFEDSVQYSVAFLQKMDGIVTRNPKDYEDAEIKIWTPEELLSEVES